MISEQRRQLEPAEKVWPDGSNPLRVPQRQPMYPLPLKGKYGRADDLVLSANPKSMWLNPGGAGSSAANGMLALLFILFGGIALFWLWQAIRGYSLGGQSGTILAIISSIFFAIFFAIELGLIHHFRSQPASEPMLANRHTGILIQMDGKRRVEAKWDDLRPYIEVVTSFSTAGAATSCNLHLVEPTQDGRYARKHMMVQNALGYYDCLATYEFLARYMEGDWEGLPDIYLLPGERPGFWDTYRYGFFNPWIGVPRWEERSPRSRRWMWVFTPLWTILFWPIVVLTMIGTRLGYIPKFSPQDLAQAEYDPARDGPMPAALESKIKPPRPLAPGEKQLYWVSMGGGAILWLGFALKMLLLVLE